MAQRTGFVILAAMATASRNGFDGTGSVPFPIVASAAQMTRTGRCGLGYSLCAVRPGASRRLVDLLPLGPQAEKPRPIPPRAGNQDRDFGEMTKSLPFISKAVYQHHAA